jgi:hypothetical protein
MSRRSDLARADLSFLADGLLLWLEGEEDDLDTVLFDQEGRLSLELALDRARGER